jgi:hypothetical protein
MELILSSFLMDMAPALKNRLLTIFMGIELVLYALEYLLGQVYGKWGQQAKNGQYKDKSKDGKENIVTMKTKHRIKFSIVKQDVMWIVRYTWDKSFAHIEMNKDAIAERGWGALNYILLDHPELQAIQDRVNMVNLHDDGD